MAIEECVFRSDGISIHLVNILYPEAGSFMLGFIRIVIFAIFAGLNYRNHRLVAAKEGSFNMAYIKGLILPSYHEYFYILIAVNVFAAAFDMATPFLSNHEAEKINNIVLPIEMGMFHCLSEGFALFLMRHGAGVRAFRHSLKWGSVWGIVSVVVFYLEIRGRNGSTMDQKFAFLLFFLYFSALLVFYGCLFFLPMKMLYRRTALVYYAGFNACYAAFLLLSAGLVAGHQHAAICALTIIGLIFIAILQPFVVYRTLQIDSQFWQGRSMNPLSDIWDEINLSTAASMAAGLYEVERVSGHLPILHFGLISLDSSLGYVAGGYSRVYFGKFQGKRVALKIMYGMELTPVDVADYYREAQILHRLQHRNVVECFGLCVMPPALTLVLEFCLFGSLFDFVHKRRLVDAATADEVGSSGTGSRPRTRSSYFSGSSSAAESTSTPAEARERAMKKIHQEQLRHPVNMGLFRDTEIGEIDVRNHWINTAAGSSSSSSARPIPNNNNAENTTTGIAHTNSDRLIGVSKTKSSALTASLLQGDESNAAAGNTNTNTNTNNSDAYSASSSRSYRVGGIASIYSNPLLTTDRASFGGTNAGTVENSRHVSIEGPRNERAPSILERVRDSFMSISGMTGFSTPVVAQPPQQREVLPFAHSLTLPKRLQMCLDCVRPVAHLHSKGYMHCDIKSLNFLVCEDLTVKLADFGETVALGSPPRHKGAIIQARQWAPPEVLADNAHASDYSIESDVYSLAIVLSELLSLSLFGENADKIVPSLWHKQLTVDNIRPKLPPDTPPPLVEALSSAWASQKERRITSQQLLEVLESVLL